MSDVYTTLNRTSIPTNLPPPAFKLQCTNDITTPKGITVSTRIDPALTVDEVVRLLVDSPKVKLKGPSSRYVLRDELADELVTNANLRQKIRERVNLKLVYSPDQEAKQAKQTALKLRAHCRNMRGYLQRKIKGLWPAGRV